MCQNPIETFQFLYEKGIGTDNSMLYIRWACFLEDIGDQNNADKVIDKGLNIKAEPQDILVKAQQHFQLRVMKRLRDKLQLSSSLKINRTTNSGSTKIPQQPKRQAFMTIGNENLLNSSSIRPVSTKDLTSTNPLLPMTNTTSLRQQPSRKLASNAFSTTGNNFSPSLKQASLNGVGSSNCNSSNNNNINVFQDPNEMMKVDFRIDFANSNHQLKFPVAEKEKFKENLGLPEQWSAGYTVNQIKPSFKKSDKPSFSIFSDDDN